MTLNNVQPRGKEFDGRPPLNPNSPKNVLATIRQNTFQGSQVEKSEPSQSQNGVKSNEESKNKPKKTLSSK